MWFFVNKTKRRLTISFGDSLLMSLFDAELTGKRLVENKPRLRDPIILRC
jgi:hypothetical protein